MAQLNLSCKSFVTGSQPNYTVNGSEMGHMGEDYASTLLLSSNVTVINATRAKVGENEKRGKRQKGGKRCRVQ
jgi:hypothetical protein